MKLGIKVAGNPDDVDRLEKTGAKHCEVRFIVEEAEKFADLLGYIQQHNIQPNFHHWAAFDGILANPAAPGELGEQTIETIRETIDIAAKYNAGYVVIHPGHTKKNIVNHEQEYIRPVETIATEEEAVRLILKRIPSLANYAEKKGLLLLTETVPAYDPEKWMTAEGRINRVDIGKLPFAIIEKLASRGYAIANDFEHTACDMQSESHTKVFSYLYQKTKILAQQTKLLHLGYIVPPYNGTDYHGNLSDPEFASEEALPNKEEMFKLLQIFNSRDDLWIIPEPATDHIGSYRVAQELLRKI